jgi:hypothetical protein
MKAPTHNEMNSELESVHRETDDSWRHGSYVYEVFKRESDNTFWSASYRLSTDGETNELREGVCPIVQVTPTKKTVTDYINIE